MILQILGTLFWKQASVRELGSQPWPRCFSGAWPEFSFMTLCTLACLRRDSGLHCARMIT